MRQQIAFFQPLTSLLVLSVLAGQTIAAAPAIVELTPKGSMAGAKQPQAAVVDNDTIHVAFAVGDGIYLTTSHDAGRKFSTPTQVGRITGLMAGMRRGPRIVANEKAIVVSAVGSIDGDLIAWRSTDDGKSWDGPSKINDQPKSAREGLHGMALGPDGQVACVWLDLRNQKTELYTSISTDGGQSWGPNHLAYHSPDGSICECCHPSVSYDSAGRIFVMWRNSLSGNRDMYLASSDDAGVTFTSAIKQGTGTWKRDNCPMDGGAFAVTGPGKVATVWRRDSEIFFDPDGSAKEQRLGPGEQPTIAAHRTGPWLAWVSRRGGPLLVRSPKAAQPTEVVKAAVDPMLASGPGGNGPVVLVWETGRNRDTSIWFTALSPAPSRK